MPSNPQTFLTRHTILWSILTTFNTTWYRLVVADGRVPPAVWKMGVTRTRPQTLVSLPCDGKRRTQAIHQICLIGRCEKYQFLYGLHHMPWHRSSYMTLDTNWNSTITAFLFSCPISCSCKKKNDAYDGIEEQCNLPYLIRPTTPHIHPTAAAIKRKEKHNQQTARQNLHVMPPKSLLSHDAAISHVLW